MVTYVYLSNNRVVKAHRSPAEHAEISRIFRLKTISNRYYPSGTVIWMELI